MLASDETLGQTEVLSLERSLLQHQRENAILRWFNVFIEEMEGSLLSLISEVTRNPDLH